MCPIRARSDAVEQHTELVSEREQADSLRVFSVSARRSRLYKRFEITNFTCPDGDQALDLMFWPEKSSFMQCESRWVVSNQSTILVCRIGNAVLSKISYYERNMIEAYLRC